MATQTSKGSRDMSTNGFSTKVDVPSKPAPSMPAPKMTGSIGKEGSPVKTVPSQPLTGTANRAFGDAGGVIEGKI